MLPIVVYLVLRLSCLGALSLYTFHAAVSSPDACAALLLSTTCKLATALDWHGSLQGPSKLVNVQNHMGCMFYSMRLHNSLHPMHSSLDSFSLCGMCNMSRLFIVGD